MKLTQIAKEGKYAQYWLEAENKKDMLELEKLKNDVEESGTSTIHFELATTGMEENVKGELLPIRIQLGTVPDGY